MLKKIVLTSLKKRWALCVLLVVIVVGIMLLSLAPAYILQGLIDNVLTPQNTAIGAENAIGATSAKILLYYALAYFTALALVALFDLLKQILLIIIGENLMKDIRFSLAKKLNTIEALYFSKVDSGQLTSIIVNDVDVINSMFTEGLVSMVIDLLKIVGIIASMFIFSLTLGLITLAVIPIIYIITRIFKAKMFKAQMKNRVLVGKANNHIGQTVNTKQMIKVFSLEDYMSNKYYSLLTENYKSTAKADFYGSIYSPIIKTLTAIIIAFVILISGVNFNILGITIGMLAGGITLIESLFAPIDNIGMELQSLQSAMSGIKRVNNFLAENDEPCKSKKTLQDIIPNKTAQINFENLSFSYDNKTTVLDNLNFSVANGEKATIVGRTGVGKTTLFKLITGLIKGDGAVTINGEDVYTIDNKIKPYLFGYVAQSFNYIDGTIKDNISLKNDSLSDETILYALNFVLLGDVIAKLECGINTTFSPALFSQGQLQLLSIARAIVYNPTILLLDEITANLDEKTEKQILDILQKASANRTIISISHRESSIIKSDKIITLENGKVKDIKLLNQTENKK
ncbi:MAG: ABC transporter ATP-binding protein [Clostridia bacterium]